jgi:hypothetical protein
MGSFFLLIFRANLLSPSTSKFKVLEGQFSKIEVFLSPNRNREIGFYGPISEESVSLFAFFI